MTIQDFSGTFKTLPGLIALISGALATKLNGDGVDMLLDDPQRIVGLVIGSIFRILF